MRDVLVVGAGPAGLAVALGAAGAGLDVAVCERRAGPLDKACGEGLMPGAVRALAALGVDPPGHHIRGIAYLHDDVEARTDFTRGPGRGVRRTALQTALHKAVADAGIPVLHRRITTIEQDADHVRADDLCARYLVAADGLHSPIRESVGLAAQRSTHPRWGQRRHYAMAPWSDFVEVTWARDAEAYVTPVAPDVVGVAVLSARRGPFDRQLIAFPALADRLASAAPASDVLGAGPLRQRVRGRTAGRVLLVGDAAGYVDALTGEGIAVSLAAATELVACLVAGRPDRYERAWRRVSRRSRLITESLLWARRRPGVAGAIVPVARRLPGVFRAAVDQLAG
ncbi:MAG TPA: FAD-dependent monooxygenase [Pseudonocardiaceae bacterium]|nr:FAD-dependent monooxygenase [Pseudonocardiaceae bacterium]